MVALRPGLSAGLPFSSLRGCRELGPRSSGFYGKIDGFLTIMTKDPRRLGELLEDGSLAALKREVLRRRNATISSCALLPADEAAHVVTAAFDADGTLVLTMDTPAWAARVRYLTATWGQPTRVKVVPPNR